MENFWDTSALMKLYVDEPEAALFRKLAQTPGRLLISLFTLHELHCGLRRKEAAGALKRGMSEVLFHAFREKVDAELFSLVPYDTRVQQHAFQVVRKSYGAVAPVFLRVLDVLQLASALAAGATDLISSDLRMRQGATLLGLKISPPLNR